MATAADGTHPTGMHSCLNINTVVSPIVHVPLDILSNMRVVHAIRFKTQNRKKQQGTLVFNMLRSQSSVPGIECQLLRFLLIKLSACVIS